jgi:hypothetical protein
MGPPVWWGEAREEQNHSSNGKGQKRRRSISQASKRAEPWPTIEDGSARLMAR